MLRRYGNGLVKNMMGFGLLKEISVTAKNSRKARKICGTGASLTQHLNR